MRKAIISVEKALAEHKEWAKGQSGRETEYSIFKVKDIEFILAAAIAAMRTHQVTEQDVMAVRENLRVSYAQDTNETPEASMPRERRSTRRSKSPQR
jgi:hypothetical protein